MTETPAAPSGALKRVQRRRQRHRERMLDVAERLFAATPYPSVRVDDIADEADVSVGTVYTHFRNKEGLFLAVADRAIDRAAEYVDRAQAGIDDPLERLIATGNGYLDLLVDHPSITRFLVSPATLPEDQDALATIQHRVLAIYDTLAKEIAAAVEAGQLAEVDPYAMATFLIGAWAGVLALAANPATPATTPRQARAVIKEAAAVLLAGMTRTSRPD